MPSLKEDVYAVLRGNLVAADPSYAGKDLVLCPICRRAIGKAEVLEGGIEFMSARTAVKKFMIDKRCGKSRLVRLRSPRSG